jgi:two-component sensor histidine kinase
MVLLLAAVPVCAMAGYIAWQNYRITADRARERIDLIREAAVSRQQAIIGSVRDMLDGLAAVVIRGGSAESCHALLRQVRDLQPEHFSSLAVADAEGEVWCTAQSPDEPDLPRGASLAGSKLAGSDVFAEVKRTGAFAVGGFKDWPSTGSTVLMAGAPLRAGSPFQGAVMAAIRAEWLTDVPSPATRGGGSQRAKAVPPVGDNSQAQTTSALWVVDENRHVVALSDNARPAALPTEADLERLVSVRRATISATARGGQPYMFATAVLQGSLRLLVGYPAAADIARAETVLVRRMIELGVLLLAGLAAVALGANRAVVQPIKHLSHAVRRWRAGGRFDPGRMAGTPQEMRELAQSFEQATGALAERETQLSRAAVQQDLLMQEIHHRVKNNLQIIASLLNLQASRIRLPEAKAEFQAARDRIRALATLHRHLYAHGELQTINMRSFLTELCDQLLQAMGEKVGGREGRIHVDIEASELEISSDQAVPMALIVTEAVSNAAKYAFPGGRHGNILVRLFASADRVLLVVEDNGVGMPAGCVETETGVGDGIGIHLIRGFARQLGATLSVTHDRGTRYAVDIPLLRERMAGDASEPVAVAVE